MCELSVKEIKVLKSILRGRDGDDGKAPVWNSTLKKYVFSALEEIGNYVTTDTDQDLFGTKTIYGYWAFQTDNIPTIAGQEIATVDFIDGWVSSFVNLGNVPQTIDGNKQFVRRPKVYNGGLDTYENLVADSDLVAYATVSALSTLSATVAGKADTSALAAYALKSGNLSQFASTTSAQLAALISDETGSGSLVFASVPTITSPLFQGTYGFRIAGATSGRIQFEVPAVAGTSTLTFQAVTDTVAVLGTAQTFTATQTIAIANSLGVTDFTINPTVKTSGNLFDTKVAGISRFYIAYNAATSFLDANGLQVGNTIRATDFAFNVSGVSLRAVTSGIGLGGVTSAFPAIVRNGVNVELRLADLSGYCNLTAQNVIAAGARFQGNGAFVIQSAVDGRIVLQNNATTSFDMLQFGGVSTSFPALKRNTVNLEAKLADDSAYTRIDASAFFIGGSATSLQANILYLAGYNAISLAATRLYIDNDVRGVAFGSSVSIKGNNLAADASAILDVNSTTKGALLPRMTASQRAAIASPADGLEVYQTDGDSSNRGKWIYSASDSRWMRLSWT